jgi:hypothetical protein
MKWVGHVVHMGEMRNLYRILVRNHEGKRSLGRLRHRWEINFKMNVSEIEFEGVDWVNLAYDRD